MLGLASRYTNRKRNQAPQTKYTCRNPQKYKGEHPITLRSRWEVSFAQFCDLNPDVLEWASEPVQIPYPDPTRRLSNGRPRPSVYVPDFLMRIKKNKKVNGRIIHVIETLLIEIKPSHETYITEARNKRDMEAIQKNHGKWTMAQSWCKRRGISFRVLTEKDLFGAFGQRRNKPKRTRAARPKNPATNKTQSKGKLTRK